MTSYALNITEKTTAYPKGKHWALVEFGNVSRDEAELKAHTIIQAFGRDVYVYTLREKPTESWNIYEL